MLKAVYFSFFSSSQTWLLSFLSTSPHVSFCHTSHACARNDEVVFFSINMTNLFPASFFHNYALNYRLNIKNDKQDYQPHIGGTHAVCNHITVKYLVLFSWHILIFLSAIMDTYMFKYKNISLIKVTGPSVFVLYKSHI